MAERSIGFVYVMSNGTMPGIVKVGKTGRITEDRAIDLYTTGVARPFDVEFRAASSHFEAVEQKAHAILAAVRVSPRREFFRISPAGAIDAVKAALLAASSIDSWESAEPHKVKHGDRVAFTMKAGDIFAILAYTNLMARRAEVTDFWQAHSDGDLLELMGTAHPGHVAGLSDGDQGGNIDPVPFLDRAHNVPNGLINGRERLVSGDRLLWFSPLAEGKSCKLEMFEIEDHCQVISRTWDAKTSAGGWPLLLNTPTYDELPPCVVRGTQAATLMALPRTWAPRTPNTANDWAPIADDPQPSEYWLKQLSKPHRRPRGRQ